MEDCSDVLFVVRSHDQNNIDVKDFNWLRTDIPSSNYSIQQLDETSDLTIKHHVQEAQEDQGDNAKEHYDYTKNTTTTADSELQNTVQGTTNCDISDGMKDKLDLKRQGLQDDVHHQQVEPDDADEDEDEDEDEL